MTITVALTGGTGFVGSTLLPHLLASGHSVRALARNPAKIVARSTQLTIVQGDLQNRQALKQLVTDADMVIHCAGRVRGRTAAEFAIDNVTATQSLLELVSNTTHFVYISSLAARLPALSFYADSKKRAEDLVTGRQSGCWTIIRPPAVYGPNDRELRPLFDWMSRGIMWVPGNLRNRFSLLHATDLARFVGHIVTRPQATAQIHEPNDGKESGYQWNELQTIAAAVFNRRIRCITIPRAILNGAAHTNMIFSGLTNTSPMLTRGKVRELLHPDWVSDPEKMLAGWHAGIDFKVGLKNLYTQNH